MGYRSQVRSVIYGPEDKMLAFITKQRLEQNICWEEFGDALTTRIAKQEITIAPRMVLELKGDGWKWYDSYPEIPAWMSLLNAAEDAGLRYEFVRIGEDDEDIERDSSADCDYLLSVETTITSCLDDIH